MIAIKVIVLKKTKIKYKTVDGKRKKASETVEFFAGNKVEYNKKGKTTVLKDYNTCSNPQYAFFFQSKDIAKKANTNLKGFKVAEIEIER